MYIPSEVGRLFINIIEYIQCLSLFQVYIDRKNNFQALSVQAALRLVLVLVSSWLLLSFPPSWHLEVFLKMKVTKT